MAAIAVLVPTAPAHAVGELSQPGFPSAACLSTYGTFGLCSTADIATFPEDIAVSPDGKSVYATGNSPGAISIFARASAGRLTPAGCVNQGGSGACTDAYGLTGATRLAVSPDGRSVYVVAEYSGRLVALQRNTSTGALSWAGCFSATPDPICKTAPELQRPSGVTVSADNTSVLVASRGPDGDPDRGALSVFARTAQTGAITRMRCFSGTGSDGCLTGRGLRGARGVTATADNTSVYVAGAGQIGVFQRNASTDAVTQRAGSGACLSSDGLDGCVSLAGVFQDGNRIVAVPDKKTVLVTTSHASTDGLVYLTRTPATGDLTFAGCINDGGTLGCQHGKNLLFASGLAVSKDSRSAYVTSAYGLGVATFRRGSATGPITQVGCTAENGTGDCDVAVGLGPAFAIAVTADGRSAYALAAAAFSNEPQIAAFARVTSGGDAGRLLQLGRPPAGCFSADGTGQRCSVADGLRQASDVVASKDGKSVYVAGHQDSTVARFIRNSTTGLLTRAGCYSDTGASNCAPLDGLTGVNVLAIAPDGKSVYASAPGRDAVQTLVRNPTTGALTRGSCISEYTTGGCRWGKGLVYGAQSIAVSPDSKTVYVAGATNNSLAVFARNTTTGDLTFTRCFSMGGSDGCTPVDTLFGATAVAVRPDNKAVYVATGFGTVQAFSRASTGVLTPGGCIDDSGEPPCVDGHGLGGPAALAVSPDNRSVYVATAHGVAFLLASGTGLTQGPGGVGCFATGGADNCSPGRALEGAADVTVSADGASVYLGGASGLAVFRRVKSGLVTGVITQPSDATGCVAHDDADGCAAASGVAGVSGVAIAQNNKNLYASDLTSGAITVFTRRTS